VFRDIRELETLREITTKLTTHNEALISANRQVRPEQ
jgi:hypothetical protein